MDEMNNEVVGEVIEIPEDGGLEMFEWDDPETEESSEPSKGFWMAAGAAITGAVVGGVLLWKRHKRRKAEQVDEDAEFVEVEDEDEVDESEEEEPEATEETKPAKKGK